MTNSEICNLLEKKPDYSDKFTGVVSSLNLLLSNNLGLHFYHDKDMNYSKSQSLGVYLDEKYCSCGERGAKWNLVIFISSIGAYYSIILLSKAGSVWSITHELGGRIEETTKKIKIVLDRQGYKYVNHEDSLSEVEGSLTELDGRTATLFEFLFSELV